MPRSVMAEESVETEVTKEVLAPAEGVREDMIATAVKFLQNPKVQSSPLPQKKLFLEKKGLTKEEIDAAIQRSGIIQTVHAPSHLRQPQVQPQLHPIVQTAVPVDSSWAKARDILHTAVLVTGLSYAAYKLFHEFIQPMLLGKPRPSVRLERVEKSVEELQSSMVQTLAKVQETLTAIQGLLSEQQEKTQTLSHEVYSRKTNEVMSKNQDNQLASEVKNELTSIKALLLNRRQFPAAPQTTPILPTWQLSKDSPPDQTGDAGSATNQSAQTETTTVQSGSEDDTFPLAELNTNNKGVNELEKQDVKPQIIYSETSSASTSDLKSDFTLPETGIPNGDVADRSSSTHED